MDDFVDNSRLGNEQFVIKLLVVSGTLRVRVKGEIIVYPHFKFALCVQSRIEFANRNCRKSSEKLLVCAKALFKHINSFRKCEVDHIGQHFFNLFGININLNGANFRRDTGNRPIQQFQVNHTYHWATGLFSPLIMD